MCDNFKRKSSEDKENLINNQIDINKSISGKDKTITDQKDKISETMIVKDVMNIHEENMIDSFDLDDESIGGHLLNKKRLIIRQSIINFELKLLPIPISL